VILSAAKMDHVKTGGTLLNMKFTPRILEGDEGIEKLAQLIRTYFKLAGTTSSSSGGRRDSQEGPGGAGGHRDLIVRVAGYSDYFCDLSKALQDEIIARSEHSVL